MFGTIIKVRGNFFELNLRIGLDTPRMNKSMTKKKKKEIIFIDYTLGS